MILGGKKSTTKGGETAAAVALKLIIPKLFLNSSMTSSTLLYLLIRQSGRKINECLLIIKNTLINKLKKEPFILQYNSKDILMKKGKGELFSNWNMFLFSCQTPYLYAVFLSKIKFCYFSKFQDWHIPVQNLQFLK